MTKKQAKNLEIPTYIKNTSILLCALNKKMAATFALKLFETPMKFNLPKREQKMFEVSHKSKIKLPHSQKDIVVYENKFGSKKVLLVHGWSGRGTQLVSIAKMFKELNYTIISFDAPGHGKSPKTTANMKHFIEAVFELDKKYGGFDIVVGHSLGGMALINSLGRGLKISKAIIIGSGNKTKDIADDFLVSIGMNKKITPLLIARFETKYQDKMSNYDVELQAQKITVPVLIIHDKDDKDVPVKAAEEIHKKLINSQLMITNGLGHRKVLGNEKVIESISKFCTKY